MSITILHIIYCLYPTLIREFSPRKKTICIHSIRFHRYTHLTLLPQPNKLLSPWTQIHLPLPRTLTWHTTSSLTQGRRGLALLCSSQTTSNTRGPAEALSHHLPRDFATASDEIPRLHQLTRTNVDFTLKVNASPLPSLEPSPSLVCGYDGLLI
jgi:hypothetical protein